MYDSSIVNTRDPRTERTRLAEFYASMTEEELSRVTEDLKSLTDDAMAALKAEFARRNLEVELVVPEPQSDPESHPDIPNLVILRHFRDLPEALLAKGGLESAGIECFFDDDNIVRLDWFISNAVGGIKLLVRTEDVAPANEILENGIPPAFDVPGVGEYDQPQCPKCNSLNITFVTRNKIAASGVAGYGVSHLIENDLWKCDACGHSWAASSDEGDPKKEQLND